MKWCLLYVPQPTVWWRTLPHCSCHKQPHTEAHPMHCITSYAHAYVHMHTQQPHVYTIHTHILYTHNHKYTHIILYMHDDMCTHTYTTNKTHNHNLMNSFHSGDSSGGYTCYAHMIIIIIYVYNCNHGNYS